MPDEGVQDPCMVGSKEEKIALLVVEDEPHLMAGLKLNFELEGYEVTAVASAREAGAALLENSNFAAIVLDVMLPDASGFDFCRHLRDSGNFTPVLMLTAMDKTEDRVQGLEVGADDYLVKPFELDELLARMRSMLRRRHWEKKSTDTDSGTKNRLRIGEAVVDFRSHEVIWEDHEEIKLTQLEYDLLHYFALNPGRVLSRQELQQKVWRLDHYPNSRMVDNFILRLRKYFEPQPSSPRYFISVRGSGYKFVSHDGKD